MRESANQRCCGKDAVAVVGTNYRCKGEVVGHVRYLCDIFSTGKCISHKGEYKLKIPVNFHFYDH